MKKTELFLAILLCSTIIASVIYTLTTKKFEDYKYIALLIGAIFTLIGADASKPRKLSECESKEEYEEDLDRFSNFLLAAVPYALFSGVFFYSILISVIDTFKFLYGLSSSNLRIVLPAILSIFLGYILFLFRLHHRIMYGLSEIIVGVMAGVLHTSNVVKFDNPEFYLAVLSASIYLIVRGFDNISIGRKDSSSSR